MGLLRALLILFLPLQAKLVHRPPSAWEDPWGKEASLARPSQNQESPKDGLAVKMIRFHQLVISPVDGPRSHFYPSSSQYALLAIRHYGFPRGFVMGCSRLMRENTDPWVYSKIKIGTATLKQDMPY